MFFCQCLNFCGTFLKTVLLLLEGEVVKKEALKVSWFELIKLPWVLPWSVLQSAGKWAIFYSTLQNTFPKFQRQSEWPTQANHYPSVRPLRAVTKGRPAQKKTPELQPEKNLKCAQLVQNTLREEYIIKTKYFDVLAKYLQIILVLVLVDTQIQLSNKN